MDAGPKTRYNKLMRMTLDKIRERHAARRRLRNSSGNGSVQFGTLLDAEVGFLLEELDRATKDKDNE